jgi:hypothetical protein
MSHAELLAEIPNHKQFQPLYNNAKLSDFSFRFKNSGNVIRAHKVILSTCDTFNAMLSIQMREQQEQICEIDEEEDEEELFTAMIKCLYGFPLEVPHDQVFFMMLMADKYGYEALFNITKEWLIKTISSENDPMTVIRLWEVPRSEKFLSLCSASSVRLSQMIHYEQTASYMLSQDVETFERFLKECCTSTRVLGNMITAWIDQDEINRSGEGMYLYRSLFAKSWPSPPASASLFDIDNIFGNIPPSLPPQPERYDGEIFGL